MGLVAGLLSLPTGVIMAAIMIFIINRRSFGWSLEMTIALPTLWQAMLVALGAAMLAGAYPAWRMAKTSPAESLRGE
jgi:putative ABC transport system permease protein